MDTHLLRFLNKQGITYEIYEHEATFTAKQSSHIKEKIPGKHTKNLFLKDKNGTYYLVCIPLDQKLPIREFEKMYAIKKLSFGSEEELKEQLNLTPGSVSLFGLLYAKEKSINVFLEENLWNAERVGWHPNTNTATLVIDHAGLEKFLKAVNVTPIIFSLASLSKEKEQKNDRS